MMPWQEPRRVLAPMSAWPPEGRPEDLKRIPDPNDPNLKTEFFKLLVRAELPSMLRSPMPTFAEYRTLIFQRERMAYEDGEGTIFWSYVWRQVGQQPAEFRPARMRLAPAEEPPKPSSPKAGWLPVLGRRRLQV